MTQLCATFDISRKTGYKWLERYRAFGPDGLHDQPRAPLEHGSGAGGAYLGGEGGASAVGAEEDHSAAEAGRANMRLAAVSTAGEILKRHGLVGRRRARWRAAGNGPWPDRTRFGREITRAGSGPQTAGAASR
nr:helix-turn-helix domain-containing protein [Mesorhizobium sp. CA4]